MNDPLRTILAQLFSVDTAELDDASSPETVEGWSSLTHLSLILALQSELGVRLTPKEGLSLKSLGDIRRLLREKGVEL